jgi:serine-type D-Ala-D-Ala carboxypeptidase (penicillin-binding protein 5/6)
MHIIDHTRQRRVKPSKSFSDRAIRFVSIAGALLLVGYSILLVYRYHLPAAPVGPTIKTFNVATQQPVIAWPNYGQSAIGDLDNIIEDNSLNEQPRPIASVSKTMTALAVLRKKPLNLKQQGPVITLTSLDVALYNEYISKDGSVVRVEAGEKITQYQMLQAMMIPSANNMSDSLALWAFGSIQEYIKAANSLALSLGMKNTTIADASGFSPLTVSTASDLILLGRAALKEPVIAEIINQSTAVIPVHGTIKNVNNLLGYDGVNGVKTGNTDEAGGCFLVSSVRTLPNGEKKTFIAAVIGAPTRAMAMNDSLPLLRSAQNNYQEVTVVKAGQEVGNYYIPWQGTVSVYAKEDLKIYQWRGQKIKTTVDLINIVDSLKSQQKVGSISVKGQKNTVDAIIMKDITKPTKRWRLQQTYLL